MLAVTRSGKRAQGGPVRTHAGRTLEFMGALWAVDQELRTLSKRMQRRLGVTGPQRLALRIIGSSPRLQAGALASALRLHPSTVTGLLLRLTRKGLVRRQHDPGDARRILLVLTARGARINRLRRGTVESAVSRLLHELTPGQFTVAQSVLDRLRHSVEREREEGLLS
jgi:MarR family transcriptional regulator, organic hydroperoxide resistance regulator